MSYTIEAHRRSSCHVGMVFGRYVNDADRKPRVVGWYVMSEGRMVSYFRLRRDAQAFIARQEAAA